MEVQAQFGDDVQIIGIPGLADADSARSFVERTQSGSIIHIDDPGGELWQRFGVTEQRTYVLVNDDGTTQIRGYGSLSSDVSELISR